MKKYTVLCISSLLSLLAYTQEFKFYLNGSNVEDSAFSSFQKGDLMRIVFSGKNTPYNFRIASVLVTLTPKGAVGGADSSDPTGFILDNTAEEFSNYPTFTFDLWERLTLIRNNDYDLSIKVNQLFADSQKGTDWIRDNVKFKQVTILKQENATSKKKGGNEAK